MFVHTLSRRPRQRPHQRTQLPRGPVPRPRDPGPVHDRVTVNHNCKRKRRINMNAYEGPAGEQRQPFKRSRCPGGLAGGDLMKQTKKRANGRGIQPIE